MKKKEVVTRWECGKCWGKHENPPTKKDGTRYCPTCFLKYSEFVEVKEKKIQVGISKVKIKGRDKWIGIGS